MKKLFMLLKIDFMNYKEAREICNGGKISNWQLIPIYILTMPL